ncbi:MAG: RluA family pseudouridine synthase [Candidatus Omnitrophica bacterium]|nr:RluA family pseudouridine synthase [Candidatus Omnitrophota bacterium]MCM8790695.1 RluA family pseudouridine synthase [Candidatus Omnitrophota bacterium]
MEQKRYKIIYEDDYLIVVDKPAGMLVIPTPKKETNTLTTILNKELDSRGIEANAYPCHRIDRDTSGLIIYAKGKATQRLIMEKFRSRDIKKAYIAFVQGRVKKDFDTIKTSIYNRKKGRKEEAVTAYRVLQRRNGYTVIEAEPVTGRTNQIRIHMKGIGHPLVGESVYAFRKDYALKFKRAALHAARLEFTHPKGGHPIVLESPLPADMVNFLASTDNRQEARRVK